MRSVDEQALRIVVVQFSPKLGQVEANLSRATQLCSTVEPGTVDLLCFPEMVLSGYVFDNSTEIQPFLEHPKTGPTSRMCADLALRLNCYVLAGYPERLLDHEQDSLGKTIVGANSAIVYGRAGEWIGNYRKTNLFATDKTWAQAGDSGFATFHLPPPIGTLILGICMDLNAHPPTDWMTRGPPYEVAEYALAQRANVLVLLNAWLDSGVEEDPTDDEVDADFTTVTFWTDRLRPLWTKESSQCETTVVICNRTGEEKGRVFAGSSTLFSMDGRLGVPKVLEIMGRREEGVGFWRKVVLTQ